MTLFLWKSLPLKLSMPDDTSDDSRLVVKNDQHSPKDLSPNGGLCQSIVVFISARALGHLGFALSLFAVWLTWLLPSALAEVPPPSEVKRPKRRVRSPRQSLQTTFVSLDEPSHSKRRTSLPAPLDLTPILATRSVDAQHVKHVYFADAPGGSTVVRRNTISESSTLPIPIAQCPVLGEDSSPRPSLSALPEIESAAQESDCSGNSRRSSLQQSSRLQKFKLGFSKPRSESLDGTDQNSITSEETSYSQRSTSSFLLLRSRTSPDTAWTEPSKDSPSRLSFRRCSSPAKLDFSRKGSSSAASDILSPGFFTRKKQNRTSAPIPRTMPYGPPYFATPPILLDSHYTTHLKSLPQFRNEVNPNQQPIESDSELARGRPSRRMSLDASRHTPHKRSLSENLAVKKA